MLLFVCQAHLGVLLPAEVGGTQYGTSGGLSILLVSPDGRVVGGTLAGLLTAAIPVQVVVGSFLPTHHNELKKHKYQLKERGNTSFPDSRNATTDINIGH